MSNIIPSSLTTHESKYFAPNLIEFSDAKLNQVAIIFFGTLTFCTGFIALSAGTALANFIAVISFVGSGVIFWSISKVKNYNDPSELQIYRKEAKRLPLKEVLEIHGWEKLIQYEILSGPNFVQKFNETINQMKFKEAFAFCEEAKKTIDKFSSFSLKFDFSALKELFLTEIKNLSHTEVFERYDIKKLCELKIAPHGYLELYEIYENAKNFHKKEVEKTIQESNQEALQALNIFEEELDNASQISNLNSKSITDIQDWKKQVAYLKKPSPSYWGNCPYDILCEKLHADDEIQDELLPLFLKQQDFAKKIKEICTKRNEEVTNSKNTFREMCKFINESQL